MKLNIYEAELEQLTSIAGINVEIAKNIVKYVQSEEFIELEDLDRVEGVGPTILERLGQVYSIVDPEEEWLDEVVPLMSKTRPRKRRKKWEEWPPEDDDDEDDDEEDDEEDDDDPPKKKKGGKKKPPKVPDGPVVKDEDKGKILVPPDVGVDIHTQIHSGDGYRFSVSIKAKNGKIVGVLILVPGGKGQFHRWKPKKGEKILSVVKKDACVSITTNKRVITYDVKEGKQFQHPI